MRVQEKHGGTEEYIWRDEGKRVRIEAEAIVKDVVLGSIEIFP